MLLPSTRFFDPVWIDAVINKSQDAVCWVHRTSLQHSNQTDTEDIVIIFGFTWSIKLAFIMKFPSLLCCFVLCGHCRDMSESDMPAVIRSTWRIFYPGETSEPCCSLAQNTGVSVDASCLVSRIFPYVSLLFRQESISIHLQIRYTTQVTIILYYS